MIELIHYWYLDVTHISRVSITFGIPESDAFACLYYKSGFVLHHMSGQRKQWEYQVPPWTATPYTDNHDDRLFLSLFFFLGHHTFGGEKGESHKG